MQKFFLIAAFLFVSLNIVAGTMENTVDTRIEDNVVPLLAGPQYAQQSRSRGNFICNDVNSLVGGIVTTLGYPKRIFDLVLKWLLWDYSYLGGSYFYIKLLLLWPISLTMIFTILVPTLGKVF